MDARAVSDAEREELLRLREQFSYERKEREKLNTVLEHLQKSNDELSAQLKDALDGNVELRKLLVDLQEKLDKLLFQKKKRNRKDYGPTTEHHNPRPAAPAATPVVPKPPKKGNHKKHIHFQNLPTEPVPHSVKPEDATCPNCILETVFVGNKLSYQLEKVIHSIKRLEHQQEIRACPSCKQYIVTAEKPCAPIPGALPGPILLAYTVVNKLADGLPNFRQSKIFKREDAIIPRSTMGDWFIAASREIELLYECLKREVLASNIIQTDDCPVKIQNRIKRGNMRKGKMTVFRGDAQHPLDAFVFSPDLSFAQNKVFLKDFSGFVQADAATGFDALFKDGSKTEVGCNAHARRRFYELCEIILTIYGKLYQIERDIKDKPPPVRLAIRRRKSKPLVKKLHKRLLQLKDSLNPTNPLMEAVEYSLKHWLALTRFLKNPDLEIDNNGSERAIKDFVLARKNFLFIGSDAAGKASAIHLSFVVSCKRNNINPIDYFADVFTRIGSMKTSEVYQLLPNRWVQNRSQPKSSEASP